MFGLGRQPRLDAAAQLRDGRVDYLDSHRDRRHGVGDLSSPDPGDPAIVGGSSRSERAGPCKIGSPFVWITVIR